MATTYSPVYTALPPRVAFGQPLRYGHRQESLFRAMLAQQPGLQVVYDPVADAIYKLDAIVWHRNQPLLPAVGVQFTMNPDQEKRMLAISAVQRSGVVSRFLYVQLSHCEVNSEVVQLISLLIHRVAELSGSQVILSAVISQDSTGLVIRNTDLRTVRHNQQETQNQMQEASQ